MKITEELRAELRAAAARHDEARFLELARSIGLPQAQAVIRSGDCVRPGRSPEAGRALSCAEVGRGGLRFA